MEGGGHLPTAGILRTTPTVGSHMGDDSPAGRAQFEALYAAEGRRVLAYALRRTAQPADAADVLAEVFLVAWRRLDDVPAGAEARLWLYGVAWHQPMAESIAWTRSAIVSRVRLMPGCPL